MGEKAVHPNDHVNMSQSSNDTFPTAMHIAAVVELENRLLPALEGLINTMARLEEENAGIIKTGRTHLQDAVPIAFSQEISAWRHMLVKDREYVLQSMEDLRELALGGTAVGTGLNAPEGFAELVAEEISREVGTRFVTAKNKFHSLTSKAPLAYCHGALKALAADLMKIANDVRWLASGPGAGLGKSSFPKTSPAVPSCPGRSTPPRARP